MRKSLIEITSALLLLLFLYTALSKLANLARFDHVLSRSPLIGTYSGVISVLIPVLEIGIAVMLFIPAIRSKGLLASAILLSLFTLYLIYMISNGSKLPCSCGGVISSLTWKEHLWFNTFFIFLSIAGLIWEKREALKHNYQVS